MLSGIDAGGDLVCRISSRWGIWTDDGEEIVDDVLVDAAGHVGDRLRCFVTVNPGCSTEVLEVR